MVVTVYDHLVQPATTNGTWTYVGTPSPNPTPPATYDGTMDFTGYADGDYVYRYSVTDALTGTCTHTADVTVTVGAFGSPYGDLCTTVSVLTTSSGPFPATDQQFGIDVREDCPNRPPFTLDAEALPTAWLSPTLAGDMWFKLTILPGSTAPDISATFTVQSNAYQPNDHLGDPYLAIYEGTGATCGSLVLLDASVPASPTANTVTGSISAATTQESVLLRVAWEAGNEGQFDLDWYVDQY